MFKFQLCEINVNFNKLRSSYAPINNKDKKFEIYSQIFESIKYSSTIFLNESISNPFHIGLSC